MPFCYSSFSKKFLLQTCLLLAVATSLYAQADEDTTQPPSSPCLVSSLIINTGYDPVANTTLPIGVQDSLWTVTALTAPCQAYAPATPPYPSFTIARLINGMSGWVIPSASRWISFVDTNRYVTNGITSDLYDMTLTRKFRMCLADTVQFDMDMAWDNHLTFLKVDGVTYASVYANGFNTLTNYNFGVALDTGVHTIDISVDNFNAPGVPFENAHGLVVVGTVTSATGTNSIVSNNCLQYTCIQAVDTTNPVGTTTGILEHNKTGVNLVVQNAPNPFSERTEISYELYSLKEQTFISIMDLYGREVLRKYISGAIKGKLVIIHSELMPGMYTYTLVAGNQRSNVLRMIHY